MGTILNEASTIIGSDSSDSVERLKKEQEYLDYIKDHISKVCEAYGKYILPLMELNNISSLISDEELKDAIKALGTHIHEHDASKFSDAEFDGYRAKYYPTLEEQDLDVDDKSALEDWYEECWKHHYQTNAHHPEHWKNEETGLYEDMTLEAILEMLCDWEAMSLKFNTSTVEWYKDKAIDEKKALSPKTKEIVEELLFNVLHGNAAE